MYLQVFYGGIAMLYDTIQDIYQKYSRIDRNLRRTKEQYMVN